MKIKLKPEEYWKLRALGVEAKSAEMSAQVIIANARAAQNAYMAELGAAHGFDHACNVSIDAQDMSLAVDDVAEQLASAAGLIDRAAS